ncbi:uncharacterized protein TRIVIDRAFT_221910 [Trichoderma virens Gv29-8]|uniref:Uncharacterized protein n=1 Tax=Hypocrea virens (strain Gv29-8 / FGSC 10586) TaxID=413071 RepID=G9MRB6_HYPVG|nr:uncharacterized protein TRIVIDRAFT_221910 [Trichoderma virens Gv29-8]EHK22640.1 hypothetical protein TRIVIDRAFT_221910 [Trichoderma virens Gv29-8]UKZ47692.1 hypothetical protein TrVGV298_001918 [Trichoderma virens]
MPVAQQISNTEAPPCHNHSSTLVPQHIVQSHPSSRVALRELDNSPNGFDDYSSALDLQIVEEEEEMEAAASSDSDIREVSHMDWQFANQETLGRQTRVQVAPQQYGQVANREGPRPQVDQRPQTIVVSAPQPSTSASSTNSQNISKPCVKKRKDKVLLPKSQHPVRQKPAPVQVQIQTRAQAKAQAQTQTRAQTRAQARAQAVKKPAKQARAGPVSGGVNKRKSSRVGGTLPPKTAAPKKTVPKKAVSQAVVPQAEPSQTPTPEPAPSQAEPSRISISQLVLPQSEPSRISISQLVLPQTEPSKRIPISQLLLSETEPSKRISISQLLLPQVESSRISISQLVEPTEMPENVVLRTEPRRIAISQLMSPQTVTTQAIVPQAASRTALTSAREDERRPVCASCSGMMLTQDEVERWQEERRNRYCIPSFKDSFGDVTMSDCPQEERGNRPYIPSFKDSFGDVNMSDGPQEERVNRSYIPSFKDSFGDATMDDCPASSENEPTRGIFSIDAYRTRPVTPSHVIGWGW